MYSALLIVLSAPSGGGKSTICRALVERDPSLRYSISCTTRPPRPAEVHGRDYLFLSEANFKQYIRGRKFVEWARVHDHYYGTLKEPLVRNLREGHDTLLALDPQGAAALRKSFKETVTVYVCPPSWKLLEARLRGRAQDDEKSIAKRLASARKEIKHIGDYDYLVFNGDLETALNELSAVRRAEHRRVKRLADDIKRAGFL